MLKGDEWKRTICPKRLMLMARHGGASKDMQKCPQSAYELYNTHFRWVEGASYGLYEQLETLTVHTNTPMQQFSVAVAADDPSGSGATITFVCKALVGFIFYSASLQENTAT